MAYVDQINQDEDEQKKVNGEITTTPETTIVAKDGGSGPSASQGGGAKGWTNLQTYVDANKVQSGKMGQDVSKDIGNKIDTIETQKTDYSNAYNQGRPSINMEADKMTLDDISKGNIVGKKQDIAKAYNAKYTGPGTIQDIQGYSGIQAGYQDTGVKADNLSSDAGRLEALQSTYGKSQPYRAGEQYLDSFILGAGEEGKKALQDTQARVSDSKNSWKKTLADVAADIDANRSYYDSLRGQAQQAVGSKLDEYSGSFQAQQQLLNQENAQKAAALSALQDSLKNNRSAAFGQLGLDSSVGNFLAQNGFDFNNIYSANGNRALGDLAKQPDVDSYNILAEIAGQSPGFNFSKTGNSANAFSLNSDKASQATQAQQLNKLIQDRLAAEQAKREASLATARSYAFLPKTASESEIIDGARTLGISQADYRKALDNNIDLSKYIQAGKSLNAGDVATKEERAQWDALKGALGLSVAPSLEDTQDEGASYNIGDLMAALNALPVSQDRTSTQFEGIRNLDPRLGQASIYIPR